MNFMRKETKLKEVRLQDLKPGDAFRDSANSSRTYVLVKMGSNVRLDKRPEWVQQYFVLDIESNEISWWGNNGNCIIEPVQLTVVEE